MTNNGRPVKEVGGVVTAVDATALATTLETFGGTRRKYRFYDRAVCVQIFPVFHTLHRADHVLLGFPFSVVNKLGLASFGPVGQFWWLYFSKKV